MGVPKEVGERRAQSWRYETQTQQSGDIKEQKLALFVHLAYGTYPGNSAVQGNKPGPPEIQHVLYSAEPSLWTQK